jgi:protein SCO1/2
MIRGLLLALSLVPVHGLVLQAANGVAVIRTNAVPGMLPSETRRYLVPHVRLNAGAGVDAFLNVQTQPWTLRDVVAAGPFVPGLPHPGRVIRIDYGSALPAADLVDQLGHPVSLQRAFAGKTLLLSFVFTRCKDKDVCPAISGKYEYLQSHLNPRRFALAEITLDPPYDSPRVLRAYGTRFGANPAMWHLLTGRGVTIISLLDAFGVTSLQVSSDDFIHSDKLFIVAPNGRVADVLTTAQWDPRDVVAEARSVEGMVGNPFERFRLSLIAGVAAFCGGSQWAGVVLLELAVFFILAIFVTWGLWLFARELWGRGT